MACGSPAGFPKYAQSPHKSSWCGTGLQRGATASRAWWSDSLLPAAKGCTNCVSLSSPRRHRAHQALQPFIGTHWGGRPRFPRQRGGAHAAAPKKLSHQTLAASLKRTGNGVAKSSGFLCQFLTAALEVKVAHSWNLRAVPSKPNPRPICLP